MGQAKFKNALINALKIEKMQRLSIKEKGAIVKQLKEESGKSYRQLEKLTGIKKSTLQDWVTGRQDNTPGTLHVSITQLIKHFKVYKPALKEFEQIEELIKTLRKCIER